MSGSSSALQRLHLPMDALQAFCQRWRITELAVFGSVLRDDFGPNSDLDVLISFEPDRAYRPDREAIRRDLEALVGRSVDVVYRRTLDTDRNYLRRRAILDSAQTIHAAR